MAPLLSILLVVTTLCTNAIGATRGEVYRQAKAATALIVAINDTTHSISLGSGFFVDHDGLLSGIRG